MSDSALLIKLSSDAENGICVTKMIGGGLVTIRVVVNASKLHRLTKVNKG